MSSSRLSPRPRLVPALLVGLAVAACGSSRPPAETDAGPTGRDASSQCARDVECDDGIFCNGLERCAPDDAAADALGCVPSPADACPAGRSCDETTDSCAVDCASHPDADGDGSRSVDCGGDDCDDDDAGRFPGNVERCDDAGRDEDCDPSTLGPDADGDGEVSNACCNRVEGALVCGRDCDDARLTVSPSALEACNGTDDDCDGLIDEGVLETFFRDRDGDGYGVLAMSTQGCAAPDGYAVLSGDCDDSLRAINPSAADGPPSACDEIDNDCDGASDEGCACVEGTEEPCGWRDPTTGELVETGACAIGTRLCAAGAWASCIGGVIPAEEACNGSDDDCDGSTDESLTIACYRDADDDGYSGAGAGAEQRCPDASRPAAGRCPALTTSRAPGAGSTDCNEGSASVRPGATEECNGVDDDCDGERDERCPCTTLTSGSANLQLVLRGPTEVTFGGARFVWVEATTAYAVLDVRCAATGTLLADDVRLTVGATARLTMTSMRPFEMILNLQTTRYEGFTFAVQQRTF